ncbi:lipid II flippase Amj family protein [uncultured Paludibaculum sp.]|uniref:lipid II flippase Amj family protein n=1 Tax=uncultured Paludibaculum sp. TaxID=1765020 RepID=UPI002AAB8CA2|nr:lipid II flippase Amj family protein [uncultured Paludibaculum sp.]
MDANLLFICFLTLVIHVVGTLAYAVRIAGIRTRRVAISFSLFNILALVSRTSNSFQGPFLAKRIESRLLGIPLPSSMLADFRWLLAAATIATAVGALLTPTFQRLFSSAVRHFQTNRSMPRLIATAFSRRGLSSFVTNVRVPSRQNLKQLGSGAGVSVLVIGLNVIAMALWTLGVFASLYAGYLNPELRVTCSTLSSVINGVATILMFVFIDPQVSVMTDDVIEGRISDGRFRRAITSLLGARLAGTVLAQILLVPSSALIVRIAKAI